MPCDIFMQIYMKRYIYTCTHIQIVCPNIFVNTFTFSEVKIAFIIAQKEIM